MESSSFLPRNLAFVAQQMSGYSRNRFRLETTSASTAQAGRIITVNLPENSLLCMDSLRFFFDIDTIAADFTDTAFTYQSATTATAVGALPADTSSLIKNVEVYINGVQVQQGSSEYHTIANVLKLSRSNRAADESKDRLVNHGRMIENVAGATSNVVGNNLSLVVDKWYGFLGERSTRFLPTDILGAIQIRITLAENAVLSPHLVGISSSGLSWSSDVGSNANIKYEISEMFFTIDSISVDPVYASAMRDMLSRNEFVPLNFKEYYTFSLDGQKGTKYTNRFALAATSIDKLYAIQRKSNYNTVGLKCTDLGAFDEDDTESSHYGDRYVPNYFTFKLFDSETGGKNGTYRYQWSVNSVFHPQYQARANEAMVDLTYINDKIGDNSVGHLITSPAAYKAAQAVVPLVLCHPDQPLSVQSGYNSHGINSTFAFSATGLSNVGTDGFQSLVVVETTAQLRIAAGKSLAVAH
jgi:hypothetical protein